MVIITVLSSLKVEHDDFTRQRESLKTVTLMYRFPDFRRFSTNTWKVDELVFKKVKHALTQNNQFSWVSFASVVNMQTTD